MNKNKGIGTFVGRQNELSRIYRQIAAPDDGWGSESFVFFVKGEGGIGKTTFLQEIYENLSSGVVPYTAPEDAVVKRIVLVQELTNSSFSERFLLGIRHMCQELGVELVEYDAQSNLPRMKEMLRNALETNPDAVVISLGTDADLGEEIRAAETKGIGVVALDNYGRYDKDRTVRVVQPNLAAAVKLFDHIADQLKFSGTLLVLVDDALEPLKQRRAGLKQALRKYMGIQIIEQTINIAENMRDFEALAYEATIQAFQQNPRIDAVWVPWSQLAEGVFSALTDLNRPKVRVYTFDLTSLEDFRKIQDSQHPWSATVAIDPYEAGESIARLAVEAAFGRLEQDNIEQHYNLPITLFSQSESHIEQDDQTNATKGLHAENIAHPQRKPLANAVDLIENGDWESIDEWLKLPFNRHYLGMTAWQQMRLKRRSNVQWFYCTPIIDFDQSKYRDPKNIWYSLALELEKLAPDTFTDFFRGFDALGGLARMDETSAQQTAVRQAFVDAFNRVAEHVRVVVCFDTTDTLLPSERDRVMHHLADVLPRLRNVVFVIAGRPQDTETGESEKPVRSDDFVTDFVKQAPKEFASRVRTIRLGDLEEYLHAVQTQLETQHVGAMSSDLVAKVKEYFGYKPIWIDLAAIWHSNWSDRDLDLNETFASRADMEQALVAGLADSGRKSNRLLIAMSHVFPVSMELVSKLMPDDSDAPEQLVEEVQEFPFVKDLPPYVLQSRGATNDSKSSLPNLTLSDVMRMLIQDHLWGRVDPTRAELRGYSEVAAAHYEMELNRIAIRMETIRTPSTSRSAGLQREVPRISENLPLAAPSDISERLLWHSYEIERESLLKKHFRHFIIAHQGEIAHEILDRIDQQRHAGNLYLASQLLAIANDTLVGKRKWPRSFISRSDYAETIFVLQLLEAVLDYDLFRPVEAFGKIESLFSAHNNNDARMFQVYNRLGVCKRKMGDFEGSVNDQMMALNLAEKRDLKTDIPKVLNQLGTSQYHLAEWEEALKTFKRALNATQSLQQVEPVLVGSILNNMARVHRQMGDYETALIRCNAAIQTWNDVRNSEWIARGQITYGSVLRDQGSYAEAILVIEQALALLDRREDLEHLETAYLHLGWTYWFKADWEKSNGKLEECTKSLEQASEYFEMALRLTQETEYRERLPAIYHQYSNVLWRLGEKERAKEYNDKAYDLSSTPAPVGVPDIRYAIDSLVGKAEFAYDDGDFAEIEKFEKQLLAQYSQERAKFPLFFGRMLCLRAGVEARQGHLDSAIQLYGDGIAEVAKHGGYGVVYSLDRELSALEAVLKEADDLDRAIEWVGRLRDLWSDDGKITTNKAVQLETACIKILTNLQVIRNSGKVDAKGSSVRI